MTTLPGGDLVVVGAGGFGRETVDAVLAMNAHGASWRLLGYLDDNPSLAGQQVNGAPVLGGVRELGNLPNTFVVVTTGRPDNYASRPGIIAALDLPAERYATIVHPSATVSASSQIGPGSVLLACVVLTSGVRIGAHVRIMPHVTLTHDDLVGDFSTLASGVCLGGGVCVGQCAYVGAGALVREDRTVGSGALVGMGSVVTVDIPPHEVWAGVPARCMRAAEVSVTSQVTTDV
jgi:sugar O-acyltransferase (sialic acid O-acetyltransferase NeuD family)